MANFKRGRRKNARSGCLFCKPHKGNGLKGKFASQTRQEQLARIADREPKGWNNKGFFDHMLFEEAYHLMSPRNPSVS